VSKETAVVTGASSGIGAATARQLAAAGFDVVIGARRKEKLESVANDIGACAVVLDVTNADSVETFCAAVNTCSVLVNNAGGALGVESIADSDEAKWLEMYERNVMSVVRMTRALLPKLEASGNGRIVNIGSVAALTPYVNGGGYNAAKFAERAVTGVLRRELIGKPVRVIEIDPGMVETDFSLVRLDGDEKRAAAIYEGMTPLTADDIADCIVWAVTRPAHVNIDSMLVTPRDQVIAYEAKVHRR
jgi:NADP-dependent 3-hydroxy acid dehydrogenase YdfG